MLPFQQTLLMSVAPVTLHINVDSMSKGRIPFRLPLVLTVGPDPKNLDRYARLMVEKGQKGLEETISGIVQGEARMLTAALEPIAEFVRFAEGSLYSTLCHTPVLLKRCFMALAVQPNDTSTLRRFKRLLDDKLNDRLGFILQRPNHALAAAALHPKYGHLEFVPADVRDAMWNDLAKWADEFPVVQVQAALALNNVEDDPMPVD